jgi:hypothetical protein
MQQSAEILVQKRRPVLASQSDMEQVPPTFTHLRNLAQGFAFVVILFGCPEMVLAADSVPRGARKELQDFSNVTPTDNAAPRKTKMRMFKEDESGPPEPKFPWMAVLYSLGFLAIATPFGWRMFRTTSKEISAADEGFDDLGTSQRNRPDDEN